VTALEHVASVEDLYDVLWDAVDHMTLGEPYNQDLVHDVVVALCTAALVNAGADLDDVIRQYKERPYSVRLNYDPATGELDFGIDWEDDEGARIDAG
jgi:hypothetical protein